METKPIKLKKDLSDIVVDTINGFVENGAISWELAMDIAGALHKKLCEYIDKPKRKYRMRCVCKWKGDLDGTIRLSQFNVLSANNDNLKRHLESCEYWTCETFAIYDNETNELICEGKDYNDFVRWCKENGK